MSVEVSPPEVSRRRQYWTSKRALDVAGATVALVLVSPLLIIAAILILTTSQGPVLFRQQRVGYRGSIFTMYKLRTMTHIERGPLTEVYPGHPEVTRVGSILRKYKIDELPQFFNVLQGDMSLVGPRPVLPVQLCDFTELAFRRLEARPGLTGLAQVNGGIYLDWPERWLYDAEYIDTMSLWLDLRIVLATLRIIVLGGPRGM